MAWILDPQFDEDGANGGWQLQRLDAMDDEVELIAEWPDDYPLDEVLPAAMHKVAGESVHPVVRLADMVPGEWPDGSWIINDSWDF